MRRVFAAGVLAFAAVTAMATANPAPTSAPHWVASWATALMISDGANYVPGEQLSHATLRQSVRLSTGGKAYRIVLSNLFGTEPLHLSAVHVAKALAFNAASPGAIDPASDRVLTFSGKTDVTIPVGAAYTSDPVAVPLAPFTDLAISILYDTAPVIETGHPGSRQTSYILAGDHTADPALTGAAGVDHWYQIAAVEVLSAPQTGAIAVVGDSITDGRGSTTNGNDRWTNIMATALNTTPGGKGRAVLNAGIGGNCVLVVCLGPTALTRFDREVLEPAGVTTFIVYEGVNDLGRLTINHPVAPAEHEALVAHLIEAFQQMAVRAKAHGLKSYIATILPYGASAYYHPDAANEADRTALNSWIRSQKLYDGVIDFDAVMKDPAHPERLNPAYDTDGLHANAAGYVIMGVEAAKALGAKGQAAHGAARGKKG